MSFEIYLGLKTKTMNDNDLKKGIENLKSIRLSRIEKRRMLRRVFGASNSPAFLPHPIQFFGNMFVFHRGLAIATVIVLITTLSGTSALYASENTVPGDVLYPVKVNVVEPIQTALITNPQDKARFETEKAVRRLEEAVILVHRNEFSEDRRVEIETRFKKHTDAVNSIVSVMSATSTEAVDIETEFEAKVVANTRIIKKVSEKLKREEKSQAEKFEKQLVESVPKDFGKRKKDWKDATNTTPSFDDSVRSVQMTIDKSEKKIRNINSNRSNKKTKTDSVINEIQKDSEKVLEDAKKYLREAESKKSTGDERRAREILDDSDKRVHEADASIQSGLKLELDFRNKSGRD
jgi:hypothetical protein